MQMLTKAGTLLLRTADTLLLKPVTITIGAIEALEGVLILGNQSVRLRTERSILTQEVRDKIKHGKLEAEMNEALVSYAEKSVELQERVSRMSDEDRDALLRRKATFPEFSVP